MNVLSLFDGISCGRYSLEKAGIPITSYYASEVDKFAIQIAQKNFPDTIQVGDVRRINITGRIPFDLLIGGSPCQGFSVAGKGLNFNDPRSALFFEYVRILTALRKINPSILFLLENVRMKKEWQDIISNELGVEPVKINSALVCAQNRVRLYWANFPIEQPENRGIILRDILEDEVDEKYYLSEVALARINRKTYSNPSLNPDKTGTINTKNNSGQLSVDSGTTLISDRANGHNGFPYSNDGKVPPLSSRNGCGWDNSIVQKIDKNGNLKKNQDKASTFTAGAHSGGNHSDMDLIVHSCYPRTGSKNKRGGTGPLSRNDGKTYCIDQSSKNIAIEYSDASINQLKKNSKSEDEQSIAITSNSNFTGSGVTILNGIRRLTPIECERLQGLPDNYTQGVSDSQRYKALGNGWQCDTTTHIFECMKKSPTHS